MSSRKPCVLVVDDEIHIIRIMRRTLEMEGYRALVADSGDAAMRVIEEQAIDLIILDIMMPGMDGLTLCRCVREFSQVPIIMLTAKGTEEDKLKGFELGVDDYVSKPFSVKELLARIKAVLRRGDGTTDISTPAIFRRADLEIDFKQRRVTVSGNGVRLTPTEYNLLRELVVNRGKILTYSDLLMKVWGNAYRDERQYLHVFVRQLRAKIEPNSRQPKYIRNVFGVGYEFNA